VQSICQGPSDWNRVRLEDCVERSFRKTQDGERCKTEVADRVRVRAAMKKMYNSKRNKLHDGIRKRTKEKQNVVLYVWMKTQAHYHTVCFRLRWNCVKKYRIKHCVPSDALTFCSRFLNLATVLNKSIHLATRPNMSWRMRVDTGEPKLLRKWMCTTDTLSSVDSVNSSCTIMLHCTGDK